MDLLISVGQFLLALSFLILFHEAGHFIFAKLFKTRVEKFYLFFDFLFPLSNVLPFSLYKKKYKGTEYGIGWFPLGGYIKISGMVDESMDTENLKNPPQPWEFRAKPAWQRLLIMLGGIIVNILLAFIIYAMVLFVWGEQKLPMSEVRNGIMVQDSFGYDLGYQDGDKIISADGKAIHYYDDLMMSVLVAKEVQIERNGQVQTLKMPEDLLGQLSDKKNLVPIFGLPIPSIVDSVLPDGLAAQHGLQTSDTIQSANGTPIAAFKTLREIIRNQAGDTVNLVVKRGAETINLNIPVSDSGSIGFINAQPRNVEDLKHFGYTLETYKYDFFESIPAGIKMTGKRLGNYIDQFKKIINPSTGAYKGIGGFASMSKLYGPTWDWQAFWTMTAFISIMLAFMNLLPIPGLDGGHVMFTLYEMITGKKPNDKFLEIATTAGLLFLLFLMLYANGMDIFRALR